VNYEKIYDQLIKRAQFENRVKGCGIYFEQHHIVPRCLTGSNNKTNLVLLTAREHYVAHKLLCEIYPAEPKLHYALWAMINLNNKNQFRSYIISSREYLKVREEYIKLVSKPKSKEHKLNLSKSWTSERKLAASKNLSKVNKLRIGDKHPFYGVKRIAHSEWIKQNHPMQGKTHSDETKEKIRKSLAKTRLKKLGEKNG
jgi:hypothetical protein